MAPDTGERVSQANAICGVCGGTGMHPGTNSGEKCGACKGFGRSGAMKTDDPAFVDSPGVAVAGRSGVTHGGPPSEFSLTTAEQAEEDWLRRAGALTNTQIRQRTLDARPLDARPVTRSGFPSEFSLTTAEQAEEDRLAGQGMPFDQIRQRTMDARRGVRP